MRRIRLNSPQGPSWSGAALPLVVLAVVVAVGLAGLVASVRGTGSASSPIVVGPGSSEPSLDSGADSRADGDAPTTSGSEQGPGPGADAEDDLTGAPPRAAWMVPEDGSSLHGRRYGDTDGFLVFRGNPTRTFYGEGPVPRDPEVAWAAPDERLCSIEGDLDDGGRVWCGIGWTGQAVLLDRGGDGISDVEVMVGGYDGSLHLFDGATGERTRPPFVTGEMVKGTETLDPDGFPLVTVGSRDGFLRLLALDGDPGDAPRELWRLGRHPEGIWNDDWDANPTILDDVLYVGGEDSWFRMWRLNRTFDADGRVRVDPELLVEVPGFDDALLERIGDRNVSIESSPAITADRVYWANSGGRVMGIDRQAALEGRVVITFDHWVGDDVDASIVVDREGMLVVAVEEERRLPAARGMGQLLRLDPTRPDDPVLWRLDIPSVTPSATSTPPPTTEEDSPDGRDLEDGGVWATPALYDTMIYVPTHSGRLLVVDLDDGTVLSSEFLGGPLWSSPAVVEEPGGPAWLIQATCGRSSVRGYTLEDPAAPELRWVVPMPGCIEATPVVWRGSIYVGTRDGRLHALR